MKFLVKCLVVFTCVFSTVYAASNSTDEEKQVYSEQISTWMAASGVCGFELNQGPTEVFIVKLIGQLEEPLMTKLQNMAIDQVRILTALSEIDKAAECGMIYEQAKPFGVYK